MPLYAKGPPLTGRTDKHEFRIYADPGTISIAGLRIKAGTVQAGPHQTTISKSEFELYQDDLVCLVETLKSWVKDRRRV